MKLRNVLALTILGFSLNGCGEPSKTPSGEEQGPNKEDQNTDKEEQSQPSPFQVACESSSGQIVGDKDNERCQCESEICDLGVVCNYNTKKCVSSVGGKCFGNSDYCNNSKLYKCIESSWTYQVDCPEGLGCLEDNSKCAECNKNSCTDGRLKTCENGLYSDPVSCKSNACEDEYSCKAECLGEEEICKDSQMYKCQNNQLVPTTPCTAGCEPNTNRCAQGCEKGTKICVNGTQKTCDGSKFTNEQSCPEGNSCKEDGQSCGECINGSKRCADDPITGIGHMEICNNGVYEYLEQGKNCDNDYSCDTENNICGVCNNVKKEKICVEKVVYDYKDVGFIKECQNGRFSSNETECIEGYVRFSCNKEKTDCGECLNNFDTCVKGNPSQILTCVDGQYEFKMICPEGQGCDPILKDRCK